MSNCSARQRSAWTWAACLATAVTILPAATARAGAGGWIAPVLALPALWAAERLLEPVSAHGLARTFCDVLGKGSGRTLTIIYIMWAVVLGGVQLRTSVQRVETAATWPASPWLLSAGMVLLALWIVRGRSEVCARWALLVLNGLLSVLGAVALLALQQVRWDNLLPLWSGSDGVVGALGITFALLCLRVYGGFLPGNEGRPSMRYPVAVCVLLGVLLLTIQGNLGTDLAARLEDPLLTLSRNVGIEGAFQRAESLLATMLLLSDLALLTLLLWAARAALGKSHGGGKEAAWVGLGVFVAAILPVQAVQLDRFRHEIVPVVHFVLGLVVPLLLLMAKRIKQEKNKGISCA